jgi:hypothetical protein
MRNRIPYALATTVSPKEKSMTCAKYNTPAGKAPNCELAPLIHDGTGMADRIFPRAVHTTPKTSINTQSTAWRAHAKILEMY